MTLDCHHLPVALKVCVNCKVCVLSLCITNDESTSLLSGTIKRLSNRIGPGEGQCERKGVLRIAFSLESTFGYRQFHSIHLHWTWYVHV